MSFNTGSTAANKDSNMDGMRWSGEQFYVMLRTARTNARLVYLVIKGCGNTLETCRGNGHQIVDILS